MADDGNVDLASRSVLVGVDGSLGSRIALDHAARRVGPGGLLIVAHAISVLPEPIHQAVAGFDHARRDIARQLVVQQSDLVGVKASAEVVEGRAPSALAELARERGADEIVVGARGLGVFAAALGSVSHSLVGHADRPVVVVPQAAADRGHGPEERKKLTVVVAWDGSPTAHAALAYASRRVGSDGRLVVVHVFQEVLDGMKLAEFEDALDAYQAQGRQLLTSAQQQTDLDVELETSVLEGPPAQAIVAAANAQQADEIVIGSRGFGALRGMLGSVSHALLHVADRPVVVIPADAATEPPAYS